MTDTKLEGIYLSPLDTRIKIGETSWIDRLDGLIDWMGGWMNGWIDRIGG